MLLLESVKSYKKRRIHLNLRDLNNIFVIYYGKLYIYLYDFVSFFYVMSQLLPLYCTVFHFMDSFLPLEVWPNYWIINVLLKCTGKFEATKIICDLQIFHTFHWLFVKRLFSRQFSKHLIFCLMRHCSALTRESTLESTPQSTKLFR